MATIDLNADLGESFGTWVLGDDAAMLDVVTSVNIACGFHAGDPATILATTAAALRRGVRIGAQVGYPDLAGFGRRHIDMAHDDLVAAVVYQVGALRGLAAAAGGSGADVAAGGSVVYVKPHGALYNTAAVDPGQADAVVAAVAAVDPGLAVMAQPGSQLLTRAAAAGLPTIAEAFADRAYRPDGTLVSRREPGAVLTDSAEIAARVVRLVVDGELTAADGTVIRLRPDSVCLHGDTPGAVAHARAVRAALTAAGVEIAA